MPVSRRHTLPTSILLSFSAVTLLVGWIHVLWFVGTLLVDPIDPFLKRVLLSGVGLVGVGNLSGWWAIMRIERGK